MSPTRPSTKTSRGLDLRPATTRARRLIAQALALLLFTQAIAPSAATDATQIRTNQPRRRANGFGELSLNDDSLPSQLCRGTPNRPSRYRPGLPA